MDVQTNMDLQKNVLMRQIFISRILKATFWSAILQCVFVPFFFFLLNLDILHPIEWFKTSFSIVLNFSTWFFLIPLISLVCFMGFTLSRDYVMSGPCIKTRFGMLWNLLQPKFIVMATLNMAFGAMIVTYYSVRVPKDYGLLSYMCREGKCLNERNLYLLANGAWIGLYIAVKSQILGPRVLIFPIVQQLKYPQVKNQLLMLGSQAMQEALWPNIYFSILYFWRGGVLTEHVLGFLDLTTETGYSDTLISLLKFALFARSLLFSAVIIFSIRTMELIFQVHLTEHRAFPVSSSVSDSVALKDALASSVSLIRQLGYLDLLDLAERDPIRRYEMYALSLPGGHPHNWNSISSEVLKLLSSFTDEINKAASDINRAYNGPLLPSSTAQKQPENSAALSMPLSSPLSPISPSQGARLRNLSLRPVPVNTLNGALMTGSPPGPHSVKSAASSKSLLSIIKQQVTSFLDWICRKPGINLVFGDIVDAQARHLLIHSQPVSWAAQSLAQLTSLSLTKDTHGVVQKDLPSVLTTLLQLKCALDRLPAHSHKRALRRDAIEMRMKAALISAVKRSLYIVCSTFQNYLPEIPLKDDVRQQLMAFVTFKEG